MSEEFDIEKLLRSHLLDDQEAPPSGLFEQLDAQFSEERRKKRLFWLFWIGLGSFSLLAIFIVPTNFSQNNEFQTQASKSVLDNTNRVSKFSTFTKVDQTDETLGSENLMSETADFEKEIGNQSKVPNYFDTKKSTKTKVVQSGTKSMLIKPNDVILTPNTPNDSLLKLATKLNATKITESDSVKLTILNQNEANLGDPIKDSTQIISDEDSTLLVEEIIPIKDSIPDSTKNTPPEDKVKTSKFRLVFYGGPALFDVAVFKPYFSSGALSSVSFPSSSYEFGFGIYRQFTERLYVQALVNYANLKTEFNYNLLITETDFNDYYKLNKKIPIENLDDPETCNCAVAEDVSMSYKITNFAFSLGTGFNVIQGQKFNFAPEFSFSGVLSTKFIKKEEEIVLFPMDQVEKFASLRLQFGLGFHYYLTDRIQLGISPSYGIQFNNKSTIYAKNMNRILIPISLKIGL